jgi:hypothetical protein
VDEEIRESVKKFPESYDIHGLVHHELVLPGESVTGYWLLVTGTWSLVASARCSSEEATPQAGRTEVSASR